jgi:hypothetical protein
MLALIGVEGTFENIMTGNSEMDHQDRTSKQ